MKGIFPLLNKSVERQHKWDLRYLQLAKTIASWSKDPSSQIGAIAVGAKGQVLAQGYNGFPRGMVDSPQHYKNKTVKYARIVHAEMNMIFNASFNGGCLNGSSVYVSGLPTCSDCAKGLIQVGVKELIMPQQKIEDRWYDSWQRSKEYYKEAGLKYRWVKS
jgi:dCMP deaminase